MAHEHQERYSSLVLAKMRAENILKDGIIFNNDYEGDPVSGAVKVPVRDDEVKVGDYDKSTGGELSEGSTIYRTILINREKYVNELIDGYDAASVPDNLVADRLDSAGYSMARVMDSDGASALISQGTRVNLSSLSASTIYSEVVGIRSRMSKANVPNDGRRYLLVTPDVYAEMLKSEQFVKASDLGAEIIQSGALGRMAGFNIYEWNDSTANLAMIAGHPRYATRVNAWKVPVAVNDLKDAKAICNFGFKAHIGVDDSSGLVHTVKVTPANKHDVTMTAELMHGDEEKLYGDSGYLGADKRENAILKNHSGKKIKYIINRRPSQCKDLSARAKGQIKRREREKSSVRAKVEHVFAVVKKQLRYRKTRYRGLRKQTAKLNMMFALANLILADRPCLAA